MLPEKARYDHLIGLPKGTNLGTALGDAINAIERDFEPLQGQLPKEYEKFANDVLENLLRLFDSELLRTASGDIFGRVYEYFLPKFAMDKAQDNGEFLRTVKCANGLDLRHDYNADGSLSCVWVGSDRHLHFDYDKQGRVVTCGWKCKAR